MSRVICAGHANWDVTLRVDDLPDPDGEATVTEKNGAGGGSAVNVANALVGLGLRTTLLGSVGDDDHGRAIREELTAAGVDCAALVTAPASAGPTAVKYLVVDEAGEVMILGRPGANEAYDAAALPGSTLAAADHLHLTGQDPDTAADLADRAHGAGVTVSFDPGRRVGERPFEAVFERADVVFLNDREAAAAIENAGRCRRALVVKHGAGGAEVRTTERRYVHRGFDVESIDTAGAGDAFAAGFLAARLRSDGYARALAAANACGALASRVRGARAPITRADVGELLSGDRTSE